MSRFLPLGFFLSILVLFFSGCAPSGSSGGPESEYLMGTICTINLFEQGKPALYAGVFGRLRELEDILSANREGTDLDMVNKNAGLAPVKVRPELIYVLGKALEYAEKSGGSFDPSVGPLVKLWGIGTDKAHVPGEEEIREALGLINYRDVEINREAGTVFLKRPGMAVDLGAIAKGYAADEVVKLLAQEGVERAIIDLGGNIYAMGEKKTEKTFGDVIKGLVPGGAGKEAVNDKSFWRIGVQDPRETRGTYIGILKVKNRTIVTSGGYERFFDEGGKRYHHILSTENGFPIENGLLSVTIVADNSIDADALSTSAFTLGWERGRDLIASIPGAEGIFVFDDLSVRIMPGLEKDFSLTAAEYHISDEP